MTTWHKYEIEQADEGRREELRLRRERFLDEAAKVREQTDRIEAYEAKLDAWSSRQAILQKMLLGKTQTMCELSEQFRKIEENDVERDNETRR